MKPSIQTLGQILYSPSQYVIPVFQRNYRWDQPQWEKLWENLGDIQQPGKTGNHFMGFLVFVPGLAQPGMHTRFHLIDGQQRLTTTSLLLIAIRNVARQLDQGGLAQEINDYYLVHPLKKDDYHYRVLPKERDQADYLALVDGKSAPTGRMPEAVDWFEHQLLPLGEEDPDGLRALYNTVCQRLEFMCATLEAEDAYNIFKSLNSTGVPLGQSDLIRNFVFMHVAPDDQDAFDRERWSPLEALFTDTTGRLDDEAFSRFFRDAMMADGRYVSPKETFATFEARNEATEFSPAALADEMLANARYYRVITGQAADSDAAVTKALHGLNLLDSSTTYPVLLALFRRRGEGGIDSAQLARCIDMLGGFILRRFVCGDSSRGYGRMFVRALARTDGDPAATLEAYLLERGWPDDRRFIEAFVRFPLYKRGYAREVLEMLERARGHKEQADLGAAQIEHVMPQTLSAEWTAALGGEAARIHGDWLHSPGNLTLSAYNQEVGNQPFAQKQARFKDSNIGLTRDLAAPSTWDEATIRARGETLARQAAMLWMGPKEPWQPAPATDAKPHSNEERHQLQFKFWSGLLDHLTEHHPDVPTFEPRPRRVIRLPVPVTHVGLETRFLAQTGRVMIDVYFWRDAVFTIWERLEHDSAEVDAMVKDRWRFEPVNADTKRSMTLEHACNAYDESSWAAVYRWLGDKLEAIYASLIPYLRDKYFDLYPDEQVNSSADNDDRFSTTQRQHQKFWGALADTIRVYDTALRPQKPLPQHWTNYAIGRSGFTIVPTVNSRDARIGVALEITTPNASEQFQVLLAQRDAVESELGFPLDWQELPDRITSRIGCWLDGCPPGDETRWREYVEWIAERIVKMDRVFRPRVRTLP
jgi:uncharacterized protein with ParB-like and HNH nuclease domain